MAVSCTIKKKNPLNFCPISLLPFTAELSESCFYPQHLHSLSSCLLAPEPTLTRILFLPLQRPHPSHQCPRHYYMQQSVSLVLILLTYEQLLTIITWSFWQGFVHVISKTPHVPGFLVSWHFCWFLLISQLLNIGVPKICFLDTSLFCVHNLPGYLIPIFSTWVTLYLYLQTRLLPELQSPISNCLLRYLMCLSNLTCPKWISFPMTLPLSQQLPLQLLRPNILKSSLILPSLSQPTFNLSANFSYIIFFQSPTTAPMRPSLHPLLLGLLSASYPTSLSALPHESARL